MNTNIIPFCKVESLAVRVLSLALGHDSTLHVTSDPAFKGFRDAVRAGRRIELGFDDFTAEYDQAHRDILFSCRDAVIAEEIQEATHGLRHETFVVCPLREERSPDAPTPRLVYYRPTCEPAPA
ncbi:MAG: hypothetical protein KGI79_02620 [Patescibacteria group bacterium]|nr:hypothetical protein [Patescibacteria group bacterium]MDE2116744.1 hypothetical protein [Patescibacteria group bacterium]